MVHQRPHVAHQRLDQRLVFLAHGVRLFRPHEGEDAVEAEQRFRGARGDFTDLAEGDQRFLQLIVTAVRLEVGPRGAEGALAGAVHVGADAFEDVRQAIHDLLEQMQHHRVGGGEQRHRLALGARGKDCEGFGRGVAHRDQRGVGQHEGNGGRAVFPHVHAVEEVGGQEERVILPIEAGGGFDLLHFFPRRDLEAQGGLHRLLLGRGGVEQVDPDGAAQGFGFRHGGGGLAHLVGQHGRDVGHGAFAHATAAVLDRPGRQHGGGLLRSGWTGLWPI